MPVDATPQAVSGPVGGPAHRVRVPPVLSSRGTVPSQMPLRRVVSHSETISAPCQYETLESLSEAVYGPYSTSAPCTRQSTNEQARSTKPQSRSSPLARVVRTTRGCDLNSVHEIEITTGVCYNAGEGNRLLPTTGPGEGVRPRAPALGRGSMRVLARGALRHESAPCRHAATGGVASDC